MGDAILSALLQVVFQNLASPILKEFGSLWGVEKELKKLSRTLLRIQSVLNDADERQINDEAVKIWMRDLKDVAYDAEDVIDEFATELLRSKVEGGIQTATMQKVRNFVSTSSSKNHVILRPQIANKINEIRERIDEIANERYDLHLREGVGERRPKNKERRHTSSVICESDVFGRENDKEKIIDVLISEKYNEKDAFVIPIVGMGGIGKTTLAQLVYNDKRVESHFEVTAWVCVSEYFDVERITKAIIESIVEKSYKLTELNSLQVRLKKILSGKKFLLVLDDVWNENFNDWDVLRAPLTSGAKGSKILVTTRSEKVSQIMGTGPSHFLQNLSNEDCRLVFEKRAFAENSLNARPNLVAFGKRIVEKCKGSPLAAKTLGGLLRYKIDKADWNAILKTEIWELPEEENDIFAALRVSYHHLPAHLKQCFAFCSIFPKNFEFDKETLVQIWMGEGFIQPKGRKQIEDIGREYFDDLLWRSFFQYSHKDQLDQSIYKMHDLIHDLAQSVSGYECFQIADDNFRDIPEKARHSSLFCNIIDPMIFERFYKIKSLRTLILPRHFFIHTINIPSDLFIQLRCFRVLDLSGTNTAELPNSIDNLKHLRFLDLSGTSIKRLPESICTLYNLQILKLIGCQKLLELPEGTRNLINLRCLTLDMTSKLISMPPEIGRLTCLQTLSLFIVGKEKGCAIGELKGLINVHGNVCISELQNVVNAKEAKLKDKQYIQKLVLQWSSVRIVSTDVRVEEILEDLRPHTNLEHLEIRRYGGERFPSWLRDPSFSNLVNIRISECRRCKTFPPLGQLPFLKDLDLSKMEGVKDVGCDFCGDGTVKGFPSLEKLRITSMSNLEEWHEIEEGQFPCMYELVIDDCPKLREVPHLLPTMKFLSITDSESLIDFPTLPSLHDLMLDNCNALILRSMPCLTSLSSLRIYRFSNLQVLSNRILRPLCALKELAIYECDELTSLLEDDEWKHLSPLESLDIQGCPKLTTLPEGLPTALKIFTVSSCDNLMSLPKGLQDLKSLEELHIENIPQLVSLPEGLKNLTSLNYLDIWNCPQLLCFPGEGLPATLQTFSMRSCPLLNEWCQREGGEDWPKISHIPNIWIDGEQISTN